MPLHFLIHSASFLRLAILLEPNANDGPMKYIFFLNELDQKQLELCSIFHHSTQTCFALLFPKIESTDRRKKKRKLDNDRLSPLTGYANQELEIFGLRRYILLFN